MKCGTGIQIGRDIGNIGVAHAFTSNAIAFANNTGSPTSYVTDDVRLNDCHILRYFSENINNLNEIPDTFERLADQDLAGGASKGRGCIFLFADQEKGLILETAANNYTVTWLNTGIQVISNHFVSQKAHVWTSAPPDKNTIIRKRRMEELLSKLNIPFSPLEIFHISRDRKNLPHALCNDDNKHSWMTVSAQLQIINREEDETLYKEVYDLILTQQ